MTDLYEFVSDRPLGGGSYGQVRRNLRLELLNAGTLPSSSSRGVLTERAQVFLMRNRTTRVEVAAKRLDKQQSWSIEKFHLRVAEEVCVQAFVEVQAHRKSCDCSHVQHSCTA